MVRFSGFQVAGGQVAGGQVIGVQVREFLTPDSYTPPQIQIKPEGQTFMSGMSRLMENRGSISVRNSARKLELSVWAAHSRLASPARWLPRTRW